MKIYLVTFDSVRCDFDTIRIWADNKKEVRRMMKETFGRVKIHEIEEVDW